MIINHNLAGANAISRMNTNSANASKSMQKLSSGLRINGASDDAAGLAISEKMRGQIRGLDQASANGQDGISMIQTAEGALSETHSILQRMRELAVQSSNDTNVAVDRGEIQKEMDELTKEVTRISNNTEFNTQKLINGGISDSGIKSAKFHIGANSNQDITLSINAMDAKSLGISRDTATATIDSTNAAGLKSANVDSVDVSKTLAAGPYKVTVADSVSGATIDAGATGITGVTVTGVPSDEFAATFTYHAAVVNTASTVAATTVGDQTDWAFSGGTNGAKLNGVKINFSEGAAGTAGATWDSVNKAINIQVDTADTTVSIADVNGYIAALGTKDGIDFTQVTATAGTSIDATGTGITQSLTFQNNGISAKAANWTTSATSGDSFAASYDATTTSIDANGAVINLSGAAGNADGESITITGGSTTAQLYDALGTTAIGAAVYVNKATGGSYTIGDTTTGQAKVAFAANGAKAGTSNITVDTTAATAATKLAGGTMSDATVQGGLNVSSQASASASITTIQTAIETVSAERSKLGAYQNRLEHTIANLGTSSENLTSAESRIRDVDMAKEMSTFSKNNILAQAAQAMLAQANQQPQQVLQLLR